MLPQGNLYDMRESAALIDELSCLTPGDTYFIQVDQFGTTSKFGDVEVTISEGGSQGNFSHW